MQDTQNICLMDVISFLRSMCKKKNNNNVRSYPETAMPEIAQSLGKRLRGSIKAYFKKNLEMF